MEQSICSPRWKKIKYVPYVTQQKDPILDNKNTPCTVEKHFTLNVPLKIVPLIVAVVMDIGSS